METTISANDVKKELYKSKAVAKLSHYTSGNLYYTVELSDGTYQFPMLTTEQNKSSLIVELIDTEIKSLSESLENGDEFLFLTNDEVKQKITDLESEREKIIVLSSDLGSTSFYAEMKGSDLNRWISKAIDKGEFIKVL